MQEIFENEKSLVFLTWSHSLNPRFKYRNSKIQKNKLYNSKIINDEIVNN